MHPVTPDDVPAHGSVLPEEPPRRRLPRPSRRAWTAIVLVPIALLVLAGGIAFASVDVPRPESLANPQVTVITYSDGQELGRVGAQNRIEVPLSKISEPARRAVLAAENRGYYSEPGISPRGIVRAAWANLRGGGVKQGASTITQQYAKNAYLSQERTWSRKLKELVIAVKLDRSYSKDEVLELYLNTVYFGRGAYGIEVAAQTWFGKPAAELSAAEGAVLAAVLRSPAAYDPASDPERARERWDYVIRGMQEEGWLEGAQPEYPEVLPPPEGDRLAGPEGYLVRQVQDELERLGFSESRVRSGGLRVVTTIDRKAQAAAVRTVHEVSGTDLPDGVHRALVSVEPGSGRIRAEYAGADYVTRQFNAATQGIAQAGSSFKPFVLAAALDSGMSLRTRMSGASPQTFGDYEVSNYGDASFGEIDLVQATAKSVNTVYVPLGQEVGGYAVAETARRLGISADMTEQSALPSFALGVTAVTPLDSAVAYATLAAGGVHAEPYVVEEVTDPDGEVLHRARAETRQAISAGVAADTTHALQAVVQEGSGRGARLAGRPAAGKTGTTTGNTAAWFVGYTPQLATAVAIFSEKQDTPLRGIAGVGEVTGGSLPARTWRAFMSSALEGQPVKRFPEPVFGGVAPSPSPTASPSPSTSPSASPSASPTSSPTPSPSRVPSPTYSPYVYTYEPYSPQPSPTQEQDGQPTSSPSPWPSPSPTAAESKRAKQASPSPSASYG